MPIRTLIIAALSIVALLGSTPAPGSPWGIVAHVPTATILDRVDEAGIRWIRVDVVWAFIQPEEGVWSWDLYDRVVNDAEARGLRIYGTIAGTPEWATDGSVFAGVPRDPDQWQELCFRVAERYRGRVHAWGFWNEPNLGHFWQGTRRQYLQRILQPGLDAVSLADPDALLVAPDLAGLGSSDWDDWLREVLDDAGDRIDVVAHHTYPSNDSANDVTSKLVDDPDFPWEPPSLRTVLNRSGWVERPVWLTETGVESDSAGEPTQAAFYTGLSNQWFGPGAAHTWLDRIFYYEMVDDPAYPEFTYGILGPPPELMPKAAYSSYGFVTGTTAVDDAELVSVDLPTFAEPGDRVEVSVVLRNTGTTLWQAGDVVVVPSFETPFWRVEGGELPPGSSIAPDAVVTVPVEIRVPASGPGFPWTVLFEARLERVGSRRFGPVIRQTITATRVAPPTVVVEPRSRRVEPGSQSVLSLIAVGPGPMSYRWERNSIPLTSLDGVTGFDSPVLILHEVDSAGTGTYHCRVSNEAGTVISAPARVAFDEVGDGVDRRRPGGRSGGGFARLYESWRAWRAGTRAGVESVAN